MKNCSSRFSVTLLLILYGVMVSLHHLRAKHNTTELRLISPNFSLILSSSDKIHHLADCGSIKLTVKCNERTLNHLFSHYFFFSHCDKMSADKPSLSPFSFTKTFCKMFYSYFIECVFAGYLLSQQCEGVLAHPCRSGPWRWWLTPAILCGWISAARWLCNVMKIQIYLLRSRSIMTSQSFGFRHMMVKTVKADKFHHPHSIEWNDGLMSGWLHPLRIWCFTYFEQLLSLSFAFSETMSMPDVFQKLHIDAWHILHLSHILMNRHTWCSSLCLYWILL